jgi:WD40 repeat protein
MKPKLRASRVVVPFVAAGAVLVVGWALSRQRPAPVPAPPGSVEEPLVAWSAPLLVLPPGPFKMPPGVVGYRATSGVWAPDGKSILTAGTSRAPAGAEPSGEVRVWDAATGRITHTFRPIRGTDSEYGYSGSDLAISFDGSRVACGAHAPGEEGRGADFHFDIWKWGIEEPDVRRDMTVVLPDGAMGNARVISLTFAPDGRALVIADGVGKVRAWNPVNGEERFRAFGRCAGGGHALAFAAHGRVLVDGTFAALRLLDPASGKELCEREHNTEDLEDLAVAPNGRLIALGGGRWDWSRKAPFALFEIRESDATFSLHPIERGPGPFLTGGTSIKSLDFSPDGRYLVAGCSDGALRVLEVATWALRAEVKEHFAEVTAVRFSPDGTRLLTVGRDAVKVWSVARLLAPRLAEWSR